jgi:hypothetical protein
MSAQKQDNSDRVRLRLEGLESRDTPATITVTNLADTGDGSLRDAIARANNETSNPGIDIIEFAPAIRGGTVNLTTFSNPGASTLVVPQPAGASALVVTSRIEIHGTGETITRPDTVDFRLFQVTGAGQLALSNLTLSNGSAFGGVGAAGGGGAAGMGGAIYNQGTLNITGCTLVGNKAEGASGGLVQTFEGLGGGGLARSLAGVNGGGPNGGIAPSTDPGFGGGGAGSKLGLGRPAQNGGFGGGGGGGFAGFGGGIGGFGGGGGDVFGGNSGFGGFGGGHGSPAGTTRFREGGGGAGMGGAIFNQGGSVTIVNSTITGNTAVGGFAENGAQAGAGFGGGIFNLNGGVSLHQVTIARNTVAAGATGSVIAVGEANVADGGAIYSLALDVGTATPTVSPDHVLSNSILADSIGGSDVVIHKLTGISTVRIMGPNIVSTALVNIGGDVTGPALTIAKPNLGPLADNGGFTQTMALNPGSPAIDAGGSPVGENDQRGPGFSRVSNVIVDIGAFEVQNRTGFAAGGRLAVSGRPDGKAEVFDPANGTYGGTPDATPAVFGGFAGSVRTAVGDVNGDGKPDTILVTGPGTPIRFAVVSGTDNKTLLIPPTAPFAGSEDFTGGGFVAAADIDRDGRTDVVVTPDQGGGPRVTIFSLLLEGELGRRANFFGIDDPNFRGGARAALGDVNKDGTADLVVCAGFLGGPRTALFDGKTLLAAPTRLVGDFFAFPGSDATTLRNGVFVAVGDVTGDGFADLIFGGGPGGAPRVFVLSGQLVSADNVSGAQAAPVANFFVAGNSSDRGGVRVAAKDADDGDTRADLVVGSGEGSPANVRIYLGKSFTTTGEPTTFQDLNVFGAAVLTGGVFVG